MSKKDKSAELNTDKEIKVKKKLSAGRMILIILLIGIVGFAAFTFLGMKDGKEGPKGGPDMTDENKETIFAVTTTEAVSGQIKDILKVNGDIIPDSSVDVYSDSSGKLSKLKVSLGDYVRKDEVIAEIDPSRPGMSYTANPVKATISGTITSLPFDVGATVSPQVPIATVGRLQSLQVRTFIPERFISRVKMGMTARLSFEAYPGEEFMAVVTELSPVVDSISRTMEIKLDLTDKDKRIKAGMYAKISLVTEVKEDIVRIPSDCIIIRFGETFVFTMDGEDHVSKRLISEGIRINGVSEIREGLEVGETIIYQGQTLLDDKAPVKVVRTVQPLK
ncbi:MULTISPECIES: efflux RND transporter periplasmic adaptor subunit [unclassified Oceanispirochaeta]|uniref:efflux RND transporter periplasmic adaptor subunit n=1 Tax=unclassified Oceanispirochaeta TaxID=2635722 RepID=UPI000E094471|nr:MULTISPECIES: efflux RND transporter periplasmic adaptor subunit [unclassified Oceanispirochaeta]MBF9018348.1 efflux RND transporter periplasmic adaptor subunit [Oceanispirochaeta sp. M2]NPD74813.1 efflux RND transporter periplasmic adaptor subunit [Oceanispirochaeta sp. M1]RDG29366.1 efflux RND transporter periplasmic adaptor subunit [Oceanispirochaeta sp. M1]